MTVVSLRLVAGRTVIHVLGDRCPGDGFEPAGAELEHVYFAARHGH